MINIFKSIVNSLAGYSFIPLPHYEEEGDKYKYIFVPLIGFCIAGLSYLWFLLGWYRHFNDFAVALGVILLSVIISGGRHILGFGAYIDSIPTYKFRFRSWSQSRYRGVLRFLVVVGIWFISMLCTYDYIYPLILAGFIFSRIYMGFLSSTFNDYSNQSKASSVILVLEYVILVLIVFLEFETLCIGPIVITLCTCIGYINRFRKSTGEGLPLLEDDYVVTAETAWVFSVFMVNLIQSL